MAQVWGLIALRLAGSQLDGTSSQTTIGEARNTQHAGHILPLNFTLQAEAIGGYIAAAKARPNGTRVDFAALDAAHARFAAAAQRVGAAEAALTRSGDSAAIAALNERLAYVERRFLAPNGLPGRKYFKVRARPPTRARARVVDAMTGRGDGTSAPLAGATLR
jgi:hypothetical protein